MYKIENMNDIGFKFEAWSWTLVVNEGSWKSRMKDLKERVII